MKDRAEIRKGSRRVVETLFRIHNKEGSLVDFKYNGVQGKIHDSFISVPELTRGNIVKFRQGGVTSLIMAWYLVECMADYTVAVMLSHDREHTEKLLLRARLILQNMKGPKPQTSRVNDNEIGFSKTQSSFYIGTAGSKDFGRSATITRLHCSEVAFWRDPKSIMLGLMQAVPHDSGIVTKESTGNGWGTWHQKDFFKALAGESRDFPIFLSWDMFPEYSSNTPLSSPLTDEELALKEKFDLTDRQIQWRREKIDEFGDDLTGFKQEYPIEIHEAFRLTGGSLFNLPPFETNPNWVVGRDFSYLQGHPKKEFHYSFGVDCAGGTGNDYSSIVGLCLETNEQAFEYASNSIDPMKFARKVADFGMSFNEALLTVETNAHGLGVMGVLREIYPLAKLYRRPPTATKNPSSRVIEIPALQYGWRTSSVNKAYMVGIAIQMLINGVTFSSPVLYDELVSFSEDEKGKLEGLGDHDDRAIAFFLSCIGLLKLQKKYAQELIGKAFGARYQKPKPERPSWRNEKNQVVLKFDEIFSRRGKERKEESFHVRAS